MHSRFLVWGGGCINSVRSCAWLWVRSFAAQGPWISRHAVCGLQLCKICAECGHALSVVMRGVWSCAESDCIVSGCNVSCSRGCLAFLRVERWLECCCVVREALYRDMQLRARRCVCCKSVVIELFGDRGCM